MENFETAFDKAATNLQASTEGQIDTSTAPQGQEKSTDSEAGVSAGQGETTQEAPNKAPEKGKGKQTAQTGELTQDNGKSQKYITQLEMARADAEKKLKEYEKHLNLQELDQFQKWKQEQAAAVTKSPVLPVQLTPEQWNMIKDDPMKVTEYIQSLIQANLTQAAEAVGTELQQIRYTQSVAEWEKTIHDFGKVNPDMWDMYESGLFKPILDTVVKNGGTLEDAYAQSCQIRDGLRAKAKNEAQNRVKEKKEATSFTGTSSADMETVVVEKKGDVFEKAFDLAYDKKGTVKPDQTVRPTSRVKYKR